MPDAAPDEDKVFMAEALAQEARAQRSLLAGDHDAASLGFIGAAECYRRSWETAGPRAFGRLVGLLKATVLGDGDTATAAAYVREQVPGPDSPPAWYARGIAAAVEDDDETLRAAAEGMRPGSQAFGRAADALRALADRDADAYASAIAAIVADFEARREHLTGVPIADTAAMLVRLGARRGLAANVTSPLLPR